MKKFLFVFLILSTTINRAAEETYVFTGSVEELVGECVNEDADIDFDLLLSPEYDPDDPDVLKPRQKRPVDYVPPILRTIGFEIFRRYVAAHNAIKNQFNSFWAYLRQQWQRKDIANNSPPKFR